MEPSLNSESSNIPFEPNGEQTPVEGGVMPERRSHHENEVKTGRQDVDTPTIASAPRQGNSSKSTHTSISPPSNENTIPNRSVEETRIDTQVSLTHQPTTPVERGMHNNFMLLVLLMQCLVDHSTLSQLIDWVRGCFPNRQLRNPINVFSQVWDVFYYLDETGIINASNLTQPREFFERIGQFNIVHLIDQFLLGDYAFLQRVNMELQDAARTNNYQPPVELHFCCPDIPPNLDFAAEVD